MDRMYINLNRELQLFAMVLSGLTLAALATFLSVVIGIPAIQWLFAQHELMAAFLAIISGSVLIYALIRISQWW